MDCHSPRKLPVAKTKFQKADQNKFVDVHTWDPEWESTTHQMASVKVGRRPGGGGVGVMGM
jgi:hypothetical protein